ncbi:MAG: hypothetical protein KatS3mg011_0290 [Acidimicrobiia bacterium]|nr:MAG: hypothetical protein KatS3mg011_0290 [Acidimicrobiia bacterium]
MISIRRFVYLVLVPVALAACDSPETGLTTTTAVVAQPPTTMTTTTTTTTTTVAAEEAEPVTEWEVVVRSSSDQGEVLWVVIPPGNYNENSLEGLLATIVEETPGPVWEVHVFDDPGALEAARVEEAQRTEEQQTLVDQHHLVSLVEGNVVRFQGPFADSGEFILGS